MTRSATQYGDSGRIDTRLRISALWIAVLFIFAYVDLFSLYRPDFGADLERRKVDAFDIDQTFLFFTTLYIIVPSLMVYVMLVMRAAVNRVVNVVVAAAYGLSVLGSAVGEWNYFVLGSVVEAILLALVIHHSWTWPRVGAVAAG
jgi:hypothetical protein